jgi:hypothetical protein
MTEILNSEEVERLATLVEEAMRSTEEGIKRFVEPARGTLRRATSRQHHIVFGRRGSGKSSLLRKAASDLTVDRRPTAYVDLETFKGHSYPDVLLSVLIESFRKFENWFKTAAVNPSYKSTFWKKLFGTKPKRGALNRKKAEEFASRLHDHTSELNKQLHSADTIQTSRKVKHSEVAVGEEEVKAQIGLEKIGVGGRVKSAEEEAKSEEIKEDFSKLKSEYLQRHIQEYQNLFEEILRLSGGDGYLFLDDLYHIQRNDQAKGIDYFHRIAKGKGLWLKVGTIRHRTEWYIHGDPPVGVKLGDDAEDIDLDLTLEKYSLAKEFLIKILKGFVDECGQISIQEILTDGALERLVLASGGVARDFLGIFRRSIDIARERGVDHRGAKIGAEDVNAAAGEYDTSKREEFRRDTLDDQPTLEAEFRRIRDFCTTEAKANLFLLDKDASGTNVKLIQELVDLRLIHKVRSRVTVSGRPGKIFESYMLDVSQYTGARKMRDLE